MVTNQTERPYPHPGRTGLPSQCSLLSSLSLPRPKHPLAPPSFLPLTRSHSQQKFRKGGCHPGQSVVSHPTRPSGPLEPAWGSKTAAISACHTLPFSGREWLWREAIHRLVAVAVVLALGHFGLRVQVHTDQLGLKSFMDQSATTMSVHSIDTRSNEDAKCR